MNILIVPSWYPSPENPNTGIFIKEQAILFARHFPEHNVGISTWGSNHQPLLLKIAKPFQTLVKLFKKPDNHQILLAPNCKEYFSPAYTWTRKILKGNIKNIITANTKNIREFELQFGKIDLIHAHVSHPGGYIAMHLSRNLNIPFVITEHMTPFPFSSYQKNGKISKLVTLPLAEASKTICVSDFLKRSIAGKAKANLCVINNFVDEDFFTPKQKISDRNDPISLLFIGRLVPQKGLDILLKALKILLKSKLHIELKIGGTGENEKEYQLLCNELGLGNNVVWLGNLDRNQVKHYLQQCDAFVLPSRNENNPVVILEALACGKPVITTSCGGPEEMITEAEGLIAKPENPDDLSNKIKILSDNLSIYNATTTRNNFMENHSSKMSTNKLLDIYKSVV
ncbi:glycosyltransferase [Reichenbachiella sp. MALMAid0571]|uniref:glycosyltransferase n=1 Tax=Reichenbachiella sp. MALMAid0571 TaxID=3143939 RepID=UPI0032DE8A4C